MSDKKTCTKCLQEKPLDDFAKDPRMIGGRRNQCKACRNDARRVYFPPEKAAEYNRAYYSKAENREAHAVHVRRWRKSGKGKSYYSRPDVREKRNAKMRRYRNRNPEKNAARGAVRSAKKRGIMPPASQLACAHCGNKARDYHHHLGYAPEHHLDVIPLCQPCHLALPE